MPRTEKAVDSALASDEFRRLDSDGRFALLFGVLTKKDKTTAVEAKPWTNAHGQKAGRVEHRSDRTVLVIDENVVPAFGHFVADRLDELYAQFLKESSKEQG